MFPNKCVVKKGFCLTLSGPPCWSSGTHQFRGVTYVFTPMCGLLVFNGARVFWRAHTPVIVHTNGPLGVFVKKDCVLFGG